MSKALVHNILTFFVVDNVIHNVWLLSCIVPWLWPVVVHNCLKRVINFLKAAKNYIMNDINDKRPFQLHEQSWHRTALLKYGRKSRSPTIQWLNKAGFALVNSMYIYHVGRDTGLYRRYCLVQNGSFGVGSWPLPTCKTFIWTGAVFFLSSVKPIISESRLNIRTNYNLPFWCVSLLGLGMQS